MKLTSHPVPFARLADLVEGRLAAAERAETQAHVAACRRCAERVAQLEKAVTLMRTDDSTDAPRASVAAVLGLFTARRADAPSLAGRIVAALTFDSARIAPAFGVRSSRPADSRQLTYSAGEHDIDLRLTRAAEGWAITGQVLGECAGGRAGVAGGESVELNELCEFSLGPLPAGSYSLMLDLPGALVEIPEISLEA
jgi:anti-sigma factor RsiW